MVLDRVHRQRHRCGNRMKKENGENGMERKLKVTVLADNHQKGNCGCEHGLSVYLEYGENTILLDAGRSALFAENAEKLGVDLRKVNAAVLSHSHYDHADGLETFFEMNSTAKLYLRQESGEHYYSLHADDGMMYIGPKKGMLERYRDRLVYVKEHVSGLGMDGVVLLSHSTPGLEKIGEKVKMFRRMGERMKADDFSHEQSLLFYVSGGMVIFNSCSHGGAANIIREVREYDPETPILAYIGGFHLFRSSDEDVRRFGETLLDVKVQRIITGHCTGDRAYEILHEMLGDRAEEMYAGMRLEF